MPASALTSFLTIDIKLETPDDPGAPSALTVTVNGAEHAFVMTRVAATGYALSAGLDYLSQSSDASSDTVLLDAVHLDVCR